MTDLTLQGTTKVFLLFSFCVWLNTTSVLTVPGWWDEEQSCAHWFWVEEVWHLFTFFCVSTLPQDVRNVIHMCTHPIHSVLSLFYGGRDTVTFQDLLCIISWWKKSIKSPTLHQMCLSLFLMPRNMGGSGKPIGGSHSFMASINHFQLLMHMQKQQFRSHGTSFVAPGLVSSLWYWYS